jgi:hypothetical protein
LNSNLNFGADKIERGILCTGCTRELQRDQKKTSQGSIGLKTETTMYESREAHFDPLTAGIFVKSSTIGLQLF